MANELRVYANFLGGRLSADAASGATSLSSAAFASLPVIDTTNHMLITIDPDGLSGEPFVLRVTAHTAAATTVTVDATGSEGTTVRAVKAGCDWVHSLVVTDVKGGAVHFKRAAGDLTLNSTSWANLPTIGTTWDVSLKAAVGDIIEADMSGLINDEAVEAHLDLWTMPAGVATNQFGGTQGVAAWWGRASNVVKAGGAAHYTIVSGDLVSGSVALRLRYKTSTATNKTLFASTALPLQFSVKNLGQPTA